jgi:hypothetical protein
MTAAPKLPFAEGEPARLRHELRARRDGRGGSLFEIWRVPAGVNGDGPLRIGGLGGRNLDLVEHRILRRLGSRARAFERLARGGTATVAVDEKEANSLGLLFRTLAPMRSRTSMLACAEGIEAMTPEETAYWLGMVLHRPNPRRVLAALRLLLTQR